MAEIYPLHSFPVEKDIHILGTYIPLPFYGVLPANAYLITKPQSMLIDTGLAATSGDLLSTVQRELDGGHLQWLWLTHVDPDHIGALRPLLAAYPGVKLVTTYLGLGKLGLHGIRIDNFFLSTPVRFSTARAVKCFV